jgi:hypothetical protein
MAFQPRIGDGPPPRAKPGEKELKPILTGQRLKSRKRDMKEKFDPEGFRDLLVEGILEAGDEDAAAKYLEDNRSKFDYRGYNEALFDVIVAGGLLAPGGSIAADGAQLNPHSCFATENDHDSILKSAEVVRSLVRRYKYLQVFLEDAFVKFLKFLNGFGEENTLKLAQFTALMLSWNLIGAKPLASMDIESVISSELALKFITQMFSTWLKESTISQIHSTLRKGGMDQKIQMFFPQNKRSVSAITDHFKSAGGLEDIVTWYLSQQTAEVKNELGLMVTQMLQDEAGVEQSKLIESIRDVQVDHRIPESEIIKLLWPALIAAVEWNKKTELMMEQAMRHIKSNLQMIACWTKSDRAQITLMVTMQEYAFINQNFLKIYKRICLLFYKAEILSEDAILTWYEKDHSQKGQSAFLQEMKEFVDWLYSAEVEE